MKFVNEEEIKDAAFELIKQTISGSEDIGAALYTINGIVCLADKLLEGAEKWKRTNCPNA